MPRIIGIDFGTKRIGLAVTDPLQIIVSPLATVETEIALDFLKKYIQSEKVELFVCGYPGPEHAETIQAIESFVQQLKEHFPLIPVAFQDEQLSSVRAAAIIRSVETRKMKRRDKTLVDKVSAVLILQEYLGHLKDIPNT
jgi:putative Holliday junction resolvase